MERYMERHYSVVLGDYIIHINNMGYVELHVWQIRDIINFVFLYIIH